VRVHFVSVMQAIILRLAPNLAALGLI
jgi:hypothetical protein